MIYAVSGQVAGIAPFGLQGDTTALQVEYQGVRSAPISIPVVPASPAIFTTSESGKGQGAILNEDGSVNSLASPTASGQTIVVYATGCGVQSPAAADGVPDHHLRLTRPALFRAHRRADGGGFVRGRGARNHLRNCADQRISAERNRGESRGAG